ncbi:TetR/AcrR family transcriptional regulator [Methylosinus sp. H3A]|uniref:TetR/AcrR family transcriptional regulator n=1 Tax=Methylosinus sp. H3A TaxID=2785786 RepID=UPI0018C21172|nr:TetR/AcrR family transcriptional regulator [Methylosinus sp. H3A]MBG0810935.1 TetR/AcrR family transcriptional regulator [Methylosinus sp. H3A]
MPASGKRRYASALRSRSAEATKTRILDAAKELFTNQGIDGVTIARIAETAGVAAATVYALFKSKEGILRALMRASLFGQKFQDALAKLEGVTDPVGAIALTAHVARAIYESESAELGLIRGASAFSPALRNMEQEFETTRFEMQEQRVAHLFAKAKQREGLRLDEARRILWMYTSRDIYRMLVHEGGWTPDRYQQWLSEILVRALVNDEAGREWASSLD